MAQITGGEAVIRALVKEGVEVVFGLPGVHTLPIYDALYHHPEIRHIAVRHEQAAAYMADGYFRVTGKPGVCLTTTGPGAINTAAALGTAYGDSVAVLNIMSQIETYLVDKGKSALHETKDQLGLFRACTRWNTRVDTSEEVPAAIHEAFRQMHSGHPGPTAIEICTDILKDSVDVELYKFQDIVRPRRQANSMKVHQAIEMLHKAKSPLLWVGAGAAAASDEVRRLAETLKAPVITSPRGKGIISDEHPLCIGARANEVPVRELLAECDLMLAVGAGFDWLSTTNWRVKVPQPLIQIDIDEEAIGKNYPAALGLVGDAGKVLGQVLEGLGDFRADKPGAEDRVADIVEKSDTWLAGRYPGQVRMMRALRELLPRDGIVICDATKAMASVLRCLPVYRPGSYTLPATYGTLGFAFPAALGAKVGAPDRKVVAICGDGGFQFCNPELATALQNGINVTVLVFDNKRWGAIRDWQDKIYGGRRYEVELLNPDFVKLAEAYGANGLRVNDPGEFGSVLEQALSADKVTVVEIPLEDEK